MLAWLGWGSSPLGQPRVGRTGEAEQEKNEKIREHKSKKKKEVTRMGAGGKEAKDYNESGGN